MSRFNFFDKMGTQKLYKRAAKKIIKRFGIPVYYVRKADNTHVDKVYGEEYGSHMVYDRAYPMKMYLENFESYEGALQFNSFLSVLDNSMKFCIDVETFREIIPDLPFPEEGDIVFIALEGLRMMETDKNFKALEGFYITHCERRKDFYQLNFFNLVTLECTRLEYNHQVFKTNVPLIDSLNEIDKIGEDGKIGDNAAIDQINIEGVEVYNPDTNTMENSTTGVTEESPCNPYAQKPNRVESELEEQLKEWSPENPYGD